MLNRVAEAVHEQVVVAGEEDLHARVGELAQDLDYFNN